MSPELLPKKLTDGLTLRWATPADIDDLVAFNVRVHSDNPEEPADYLGHWVRDLMEGQHPTTKAADFTVVIDENAGGKIVSSLNLISQRWAYDGVEFGVGRPELVGTDENYRRRGLVKAQMDIIHAKSAARGERVQAITGIPWYYRQFGYEMCVDLHGGRDLHLSRISDAELKREERFTIRPSTEADMPVLHQLYKIQCQGSLLSRVRDDAQLKFEAFQASRQSPYARNMFLIETSEGQAVGYVVYFQWLDMFGITEIATMPGYPLREVALFVVRYLKAQADGTKVKRIYFNCEAGHPVFKAVDWELDKSPRPYAWFLRVPDLPAFLLHIGPVLENRLANSVMDGYSGETKLNFYRTQLKLVWQQGKLTEVKPYQPSHFQDGDAFFPDLTFLQLLFGYRSLAELEQAFNDVSVRNGDTAVLLNGIFPQKDSWISVLG